MAAPPGGAALEPPLQMARFLRQISLDAREGHVSAEIKQQVKSAIFEQMAKAAPTLEEFPHSVCVYTDEANKHPLVPLLQQLSACYNEGLITAEQKLTIKTLLLGKDFSEGKKKVETVTGSRGPTWVSSISLDVLICCFSFMDAVTLYSFTASCQGWYRASVSGERALTMWRGRLLKLLGKSAGVPSTLDELYSVEDWRHAYLEMVRFHEASLFQGKPRQPPKTIDQFGGDLSDPTASRLAYLRMLVANDGIEKQNELVMEPQRTKGPRALAVRQLYGQKRSTGAARMQIGMCRTGDDGKPGRKHLVVWTRGDKQTIDVWDLHTAEAVNSLSLTSLRDYRVDFRSRLIAVNDGTKVTVYPLIAGPNGVYNKAATATAAETKLGDAPKQTSAAAASDKKDAAPATVATAETKTAAPSKPDQPNVGEVKTLSAAPLCTVQCPSNPLYMKIAFVPRAVRHALLVLAFAGGQVRIYDACSGEMLHKLFSDENVFNTGGSMLEALKQDKSAPLLFHTLSLDTTADVAALYLLRVANGTDFRLVDLVNGKVSKSFKPHPKNSPAQFAFLYQQPAGGKRKRSTPIIVSGHADSSVLVYWINTQKSQWLHVPSARSEHVEAKYPVCHTYHLEADTGFLLLRHLGWEDETWAWDLSSLETLGKAAFQGALSQMNLPPLTSSMLPDTGGMLAPSTEISVDKYKVLAQSSGLYVWSWLDLKNPVYEFAWDSKNGGFDKFASMSEKIVISYNGNPGAALRGVKVYDVLVDPSMRSKGGVSAYKAGDIVRVHAREVQHAIGVVTHCEFGQVVTGNVEDDFLYIKLINVGFSYGHAYTPGYWLPLLARPPCFEPWNPEPEIHPGREVGKQLWAVNFRFRNLDKIRVVVTRVLGPFIQVVATDVYKYDEVPDPHVGQWYQAKDHSLVDDKGLEKLLASKEKQYAEAQETLDAMGLANQGKHATTERHKKTPAERRAEKERNELSAERRKNELRERKRQMEKRRGW